MNPVHAQSRFSFVPALLWLIAFVCALNPINDLQYVFFSGSVLATFLWSMTVFGRELEKGWVIPKSPVLLFAALFWALVFASVFWSDIKPASIMGFCIFSFMPLTFFGHTICGDEKSLRFIARVLAAVFAVLALWAMFQFEFLNAYFMGQARHPLADPSSLGALLSLGMFASLGWIFLAPTKRQATIAAVLTGLLLSGIIATAARGPVFAMVIPLAVLLFLMRGKIKARARSLVCAFLIAAVFYGITLTGMHKKFDMGQRLFGTVAMTMPDISNNRIDIWSSTLDIIKEHPLLGTGIGTFAMYYPEYRRISDQEGAYFTHNDPLQFFQELGVFGPLLFYAFVFAAMFRTSAALKRMKEEGDEQGYIVTAALFCGLAAMVIQSHVSFNHYNASILLMNGLLLAIWFRQTARVCKDETTTISAGAAPQGLLRLLIAVPFVMILWIVGSLLAGEYYATKAKNDLFADNMVCWTDKKIDEHDCFEAHINLADKVSMGMNSRAYLFAVNVPLAILQMKAGKFKDEKEAKDLYDQVAYYMRRVLEINPRDASAHYYLGRVQTLVPPSVVPKGAPSAEDEFKTTLRMDPTHVGARMTLLALYERDKRPVADRLAIMEPGRDYVYVTPLATNYYGELARLYVEANDYGKMQQVLKLAREFQQRSEYSKARQGLSLPQAIMGGDAHLPQMP